MTSKIENRQIYFDDKAVFPVNRYPNECTICHSKFETTPYYERINILNPNNDISSSTGNAYIIQVVFRCPACFFLLISTYQLDDAARTFIFNNSQPIYPESKNINKAIANLSPSFEEIYQQAAKAEEYELYEIAGCGYRKALEYLIKDFCIRHLQCDKSVINEKNMAKCIEEDIKNENIKKCAKRATWLGNDETHYSRKWNKDLNDLKKLIELSMHWILAELETKQYLDEMPDK
jgi:hypothetical protein